MSEAGAAAARAFRERIEAPGHAVDNVRAAVHDLDGAFASGALERTAVIDAMLGDLGVALDPGAGRLGGKSPEAARLIARAIARELDRQV